MNDLIEDFVKKLESIPVVSQEDTNKFIAKNQNIIETICNIVSSAKYRRTAIDIESKDDIKNKISKAIHEYLPIEFSIPFGGYKNYRIPTYPEADWAEVFNLRYMIKYLLPISKLYGPGVILYYSYNSDIIHEVNNMPLLDQQAYEMSFNGLISHFNSQLPNNFQIRTQQINKLYSNDTEWKSELQSLFNRNRENWEKLYDKTSRDKKLNSAKHNLIIEGERNLKNLSNQQLEEEFKISAMKCDAIDSLSKRREFNKFSHRIQLVFIRGPKPSIHIGSCEGSTMHFWVGIGLLSLNTNLITPTILSYSQYKELQNKFKYMETNSKFVCITKNFEKIPYIHN